MFRTIRRENVLFRCYLIDAIATVTTLRTSRATRTIAIILTAKERFLFKIFPSVFSSALFYAVSRFMSINIFNLL